MTRPLAYVGNGDLREFTDANMLSLRALLQQAYANQLANGGQGRVFLSTAGAYDTSATDTTRTRTSHPSFFPGTGAQTVNTYHYSVNATNQGSDEVWAPLYWNGNEIQRSNAASMAAELFPDIRDEIRQGNELGSYRIATTSPGAGWVNQGVAFQDRIHNGSYSNNNTVLQTTWYLWLKTSTSEAFPGDPQLPVRWNGNDIDQAVLTANSNMVQSYLLPQFANWVDGYMQYRVTTNNQNINKGVFYDRRRSGTSNIQTGGNSYISYPTGGAYTYRTYYFNVG